ncbi:DUF4386 family protein [Actinoplanes sp. NPDC049548]|uniref:DUF4386 family protein n=1 Tax=Actinoplanes sp. NPDC049548 TaxID=3155152 RepID=UPI00341DEB0B
MALIDREARRGRALTGLLLIAGALVANVAFAALGVVFDYPDVLQHPAGEILARFHSDALLIGGLFLLLAVGAGLLAPIAVRLSRLAGPGRVARAAAVVGVAAAAVQVVGLLRWPLVVPFLAGSAGAVETFETLHTVLGKVVGESVGYTLTAAWTVLIVVATRRAGLIGRGSAVLGFLSAPMILAGLLVPLGVPGADLTNFVGYVVWSLWLVVSGVGLIRGR